MAKQNRWIAAIVAIAFFAVIDAAIKSAPLYVISVASIEDWAAILVVLLFVPAVCMLFPPARKPGVFLVISAICAIFMAIGEKNPGSAMPSVATSTQAAPAAPSAPVVKPQPGPDGIVWDSHATPQADTAPAIPAADPAADYLVAAMTDANKCRDAGGDTMGCFVKASPQRCKQTAIEAIGNPDTNRRTWMLCIRSCAAGGSDCQK